MKRRQILPGLIAAPFCGVVNAFGGDREKIRIVLNALDPAKSRLFRGENDRPGIEVGFGKEGYLPEGKAFQGGYSLLGEFEVNAILSRERFEMSDELIQESGKSREWLEEHLFSNMNAIDFDGDGEGGEYGEAFIGLAPLNSTAKQPFHFGEYKGVFRWYSYALHGTQDESRIGKCVTGGCINVVAESLSALASKIALGDLVCVDEAV